MQQQAVAPVQQQHRDPSSFLFNDDELRQIQEHVDGEKPRLSDITDNLATDAIRVPEQNFALISIVAKDWRQKHENDKTCLKIRGVFRTLEEANQHAKRISQHDSTFDILVVSMYEWLMIPPDMDRIGDQVYNDELLNSMISEYRMIQERTRVEFDVRKEGLKTNTHATIQEEEEEGVEESKGTNDKEEEETKEKDTVA